MKRLCVDIGGTRIKSAIIDSEENLERIKLTETKNILTLGWLNHSLTELFSTKNKLGIVHQYYEKKFDQVAICFPGSFSSFGVLKDRDDLVKGSPKVPRNIKAKIENVVNKPVVVINDADAWLRGIKVTHDNDSIFLSIILGTGVGVGIMPSNANSPDLIDVNHLSWTGSNLEKVAGKQINLSWEVHGIVGKGFFSWIENERKEWCKDKIRKEYTSRAVALLKDIVRSTSDSNFPIERIYFGGGGAEWLDSEIIEKERGIKVEILTRMHGLEFNPDLIPLIGLGHLVSE